ncbi:MAG TPA: MCP four helix bundle domain-containing protein, partial [Candidatus Wallbacteria bacterium]|nr:MCP four helix bundle domain-containing protein [Candidatus Wallbacteria bacterium]
MAKSGAEYEKGIISPEMKTLFDQFKNLNKEYDEKFLIKVPELAILNKDTEALALIQSDEALRIAGSLQETIDKMMDMKTKQSKQTSDNNTILANGAISTMTSTIVFGIIIALFFGWFISANINAVLAFLMAEAKKLAEAVQSGKLDIRGDVEATNFEFRPIVVGVNGIMDAFVRPLNVTAEYVDRISKGDIPAKITDTYHGDFNEIKNNLNQCIDTVSTLVKDANMLAGAAVEGKLASRADASKHQGDFRKIVEGINQTLDAVIRPLNVAAEYIDRISKGDIPAKITDNYSGDFNEIKNNLNQCIDGLGGLTESNKVLQRMANNDYTVNVTGNYNGVFAEVAKAVNQVEERIQHLTSTIVNVSNGELAELEAYKQLGNGSGRRSENDHVAPAMIRLMGNLRELISDFNMLSRSAIDGKLSTRADAAKHHGDFKKIVEGVNQTLDAVIGPLNVAANYVDKISKGDIPPRITDKYNGDFNEIKNNLNTCIDALNLLIVDDGGTVLEEAAAKNLTVRMSGNYQGAYNVMKTNINKVIENLDIAFSQVFEATEQVSAVSGEMS